MANVMAGATSEGAEVARLREVIAAAYEDLRDGDEASAFAILRTAAAAFPSVPPAPPKVADSA